VGRHLFDKVIGPKGILRNKTRILVTNKASVLPNVDQIVVLKNGSISEFGSFDELIDRNGDFAQFVSEYVSQQESHEMNDQNEEELELLSKLKLKVKPFIERQESVKSDSSESSTRRPHSRVVSNDKDIKEKTKDLDQNKGKLIEEEKAKTVPFSSMIIRNTFNYLGSGVWVYILSYLIGHSLSLLRVCG